MGVTSEELPYDASTVLRSAATRWGTPRFQPWFAPNGCSTIKRINATSDSDITGLLLHTVRNMVQFHREIRVQSLSDSP